MKIVIDIEEKRFRDIQRISTVQLKGRTPTLEQVIAHGTPLPKGHGRLIDGDELESRMKIGYNIVKAAETIIEADEAEGEDEE